jgi:hypothetical protein
LSEPSKLGEIVERWAPPPGSEPLTEAEGAVVCQVCGYPRRMHRAPRGTNCPSRFHEGRFGPGVFRTMRKEGRVA